MNTFLTNDNQIIHPHLSHILNSYYFSTDYSVFAYDSNGLMINKCAKQESDEFLSIINTIALQNLTKIKATKHTNKDSLLIELDGDLYCLIAPVFHNKIFICFLMTTPFSLKSNNRSVKRNIYIALSEHFKSQMSLQTFTDLPVIDHARLSYLGQLFYHLIPNSIYIGDQHFIPKKKMKDTQLGSTGIIENLKDRENFINIQILENIASELMQMNLEQALKIYTTNKMFMHAPNLTSCLLKQLKYHYVAMITMFQYLLGNHFNGLTSDLHQIAHEAINKLDRCQKYNELHVYGEFIITTYYKAIKSFTFKDLSPNISKAIDFIHQYYNTNLTLTDVASSIPINESYLSSLFKKECEQSFKQYLNNYRIEKAIYLMKTSNLSLLDIALQVGFDSTSYFSTVFKKYKGVCPRHYLRQKNL